MAKKKKMSKAQAAAARRELDQHDIARQKIKEKNAEIRQTQRRVQKEQNKNPMFVIIVGSIIVIAIFITAWIVTIGPGMLMN